MDHLDKKENSRLRGTPPECISASKTILILKAISKESHSENLQNISRQFSKNSCNKFTSSGSVPAVNGYKYIILAKNHTAQLLRNIQRHKEENLCLYQLQQAHPVEFTAVCHR